MNPTILVGPIDHFEPDVQAMIIAMYSRSYGPVMSRLPKTQEEEDSLRTRLEKYYIGYGHKSVSQLGSTTIFLEGVSQLAAKAIENHPLFNGQESSTRYIDFSSQPMYTFDDESITQKQEIWRELYKEAVPLTIAKLKQEYPLQEGQKPEIWENTIKARAFDICRSLLPAGCTTNVAFSGTFDTINDHFGQMLRHPSQEMRDIATRVLTQLKEKYSHATPGVEELSKRFSYCIGEHFYETITMCHVGAPAVKKDDRAVLEYQVYDDVDNLHRKLLILGKHRQKGQELPKQISSQIRFWMRGLLDFGSFRDLHRHRNGVCLMPLLTTRFGFHQWYLDNLPESIAQKAKDQLHKQDHEFNHIGITEQVQNQYAIPMGAMVPIRYNCELNQLIYLMELRTGKTVHQTLRKYMHDIFGEFNKDFTIPIHADLDEDNFTLKRGQQTFATEFK